MENCPKKLLDQVREAIRIKQYSYSTGKTNVHWANRYFPSDRLPTDSRSGVTRRYNLDPGGLQRAVKRVQPWQKSTSQPARIP